VDPITPKVVMEIFATDIRDIATDSFARQSIHRAVSADSPSAQGGTAIADSALRLRLFAREHFAQEMINRILAAYRSGEMHLRSALKACELATSFCSDEAKLRLLALATSQAVSGSEPKYRGARKPPFPQWLQEIAGAMVNVVREENPDLPLRASDGESVISTTIRSLVDIKLVSKEHPISEATLYEWYLKEQKRRGSTPTRGRPRKVKDKFYDQR
jgi:hypothetical protein